ncbi:hypothetical protein ACHAXR_007932 [Thalassiosira sp. AJA248-18]
MPLDESSPKGSSAEVAEQLAEEALTDASTPPPPPHDEEEDACGGGGGDSTTITATTTEESSPSPPSPSLHDQQLQPSGTHISEEMNSIATKKEEEKQAAIILADDAAMTSTPPPPLFNEEEAYENNNPHQTTSTAMSIMESSSSRLSPPRQSLVVPAAVAPSPPKNNVQFQQQFNQHHQQQQHQQHQSPRPTNNSHPLSSPGGTHQNNNHPGRRSITLRLLEEKIITNNNPQPQPQQPPYRIASPLMTSVKGAFVKSNRRFRSLSLSNRALTNVVDTAMNGTTPHQQQQQSQQQSQQEEEQQSHGEKESTIDRGTLTVSWYEGTTSMEMQEHVFNCVLRKLNDAEDGKNKKNSGGRGKKNKMKLEDVRLLDENVTPHGEVVLCPFLPDGSHFLLKFKIKIDRPPSPHHNAPTHPPPPKVINHRLPNPYAGPPLVSTAPDSPSAEPSPFPSSANLHSLAAAETTTTNHLNPQAQHQQMQVLNAVATLLQHQQQQPGVGHHHLNNIAAAHAAASQLNGAVGHTPRRSIPPLPMIEHIIEPTTTPRGGGGEYSSPTSPREEKKEEDNPTNTTLLPRTPRNSINSLATVMKKTGGAAGSGSGGTGPMMEPIAENSTTDQLIEQQLRQLNELFLQRRSIGGGVVANPNDSDAVVGTTSVAAAGSGGVGDDQAVRAYHRDEKKQVIFVIANYLVLFMSLIALSAEIQSRLPQWMDWVQQNYDSVQNCATDQGALIECLGNGDFSGLVASFLLWATQSAAAKRIFLFGFDTPKKLWTVVYEALVTAVCWGTSYLFIRRGLNPNTRQNFLHKYWKDAVYGSLAGFNAAFMKAVLKNLIPQDVALEALEGRQLRIFHWLGTMLSSADEL